MSIVTLRSAETFWEREVRESLFWLVDGLVWGGGFDGEEGGRRTVRVRRLRTWWVVGKGESGGGGSWGCVGMVLMLMLLWLWLSWSRIHKRSGWMY